jgi:hypothetical protein
MLSLRRGGWCSTWIGTEIRIHDQQEQSAYNGHFASTRYHPLLLFNVKAIVWPSGCGRAMRT